MRGEERESVSARNNFGCNFSFPTITKSLSSADQPSSRFEMAEMENVSWSRRDLGEKDFFAPALYFAHRSGGRLFLRSSSASMGKGGLDWRGGMEYGGRNWGSLAPFSAAEFIGRKSLIEVQLIKQNSSAT